MLGPERLMCHADETWDYLLEGMQVLGRLLRIEAGDPSNVSARLF